MLGCFNQRKPTELTETTSFLRSKNIRLAHGTRRGIQTQSVVIQQKHVVDFIVFYAKRYKTEMHSCARVGGGLLLAKCDNPHTVSCPNSRTQFTPNLPWKSCAEPTKYFRLRRSRVVNVRNVPPRTARLRGDCAPFAPFARRDDGNTTPAASTVRTRYERKQHDPYPLHM